MSYFLPLGEEEEVHFRSKIKLYYMPPAPNYNIRTFLFDLGKIGAYFYLRLHRIRTSRRSQLIFLDRGRI
jgi:hypothetical protein